jgi:hypothetical protein
MTKSIPLTQNKFAFVDDEDFEWLSQWKWFFDGKYAMRQTHIGMANGKQIQKPIRMHRQILNTPPKLWSDHINGDKLDNRRCNLRICTPQQNNQNRSASKKGYKGVYWHKINQKWVAQIKKDNKTRHIGCFDSLDEALLSYNKAAAENHGEFAKLNPTKHPNDLL